MLPAEDDGQRSPSSGFSDGADDDDDEDDASRDPSLDWPEVHQAVQDTITELGGRVHPKLNWSAPKDAAWISVTNSLECQTANDIYLLLKSSDFVSHDLAHAFDGCAVDDGDATETAVPYHLVLRKSIPSVIPSMEFRCFVKARAVVGICQRDLNHYDFLPSLLPTLQRLILDFFAAKIRDKFPDPNYVFDVYIPQPKERARVWLIDINPWAPRTDPLLFSWMELLSDEFPPVQDQAERAADGDAEGSEAVGADDAASDSDAEEVPHVEFRIVKRDDPEAYSFTTPQYSAHKLPKEVVDAGMTEGGIREFLERWNNIQFEDAADSDGDEG